MRKCGLLFFVSSVVALVVAYTAQVVFHLLPCRLCIYERIPYFLVLILSIVLMVKRDKYSFWAAVGCYVGGALLSFYHAGLEYGWFADLLHCTGDMSAKTSLSVSDMKRSLLNNDVVVSCSRPGFTFWGLSISGWNFVYSVFCLVAVFLIKKSVFSTVVRSFLSSRD